MNPPVENCPDVEDCISDPSEIGHVFTFGPLCGTCIVYRVLEPKRGLLLGTCRIRSDRGEFPCTAPICDSYVPRAGALDAKGRATESPTVEQLARAAEQHAPGVPRVAAAAAPRKRRIPDGPVGEREMTREELKARIREAMDEEPGGLGPLAPRWEGGLALLKPKDPALQAKEPPREQLFHKVVM